MLVGVLIVALSVGFVSSGCSGGSSGDADDITGQMDIVEDIDVGAGDLGRDEVDLGGSDETGVDHVGRDALDLDDQDIDRGDGTGDDVEVFVPIEAHLEKHGDFTLVWLAGTPYEMGRQHGELLHDTIAEAMVFVANDPLLSSLPTLAEALGIIDIAQQSTYPDILEECQGLVDATSDVGFTMTFCLALNFGDVMLEFIENGIPEAGPGCTSVLARGDATPDGRLYHSRNLDWGGMNLDIIYHNPVIFIRQPADGIPHVYVGFPLNLSPYTGMNLAGISIGSHEAEPASPAEQSATGRSHVQMVAQLLKHSKSMEDVRTFLHAEKHMSVEMFSVGDGQGQTGAVFEMTASRVMERPLEDDVVFVTNHFVHPDMVAKHAKPSSGSKARFKRLTQLVPRDAEESVYGTLDIVGMAGVMRDPINPDLEVQPTPAEIEASGWDIDGAIGLNAPMHLALFDPDRLLFWVAAGIPPVHVKPYTCFSLKELLGMSASDGSEECPGIP